MSYEQNKERLISASRRDGYFSYVSTRDSEVRNRPYCRSIAKEHDLAHHAYLRLPLLRRRGVNIAKPPHHQFRPLAHQQHATVKLLHPH